MSSKSQKYIKILSKQVFCQYMKSLYFNDDNIESKDVCIIEIMNSESDSNPDNDFANGCNTAWFKETHPNVHTIVCDDIEGPLVNKGITLKEFTKEMGYELYRFIWNNANKDKFIIHCSAGISRSGAVGIFLFNFLKEFYPDFVIKMPEHDTVHPNQLILRTMNRINRYMDCAEMWNPTDFKLDSFVKNIVKFSKK